MAANLQQVKIGLLGAGGRMGRALVEAVLAQPRAALRGGCDRANHPAQGKPLHPDTPHLLGSDEKTLAQQCDVLVDFSAPQALEAHLQAAEAAGCAILIGTTGLEPQHFARMAQAATKIPVLQSFNTSVGVNVLAQVVQKTAAVLGTEWDIEICEMHHRHKVDAPSGTALLLGRAAARGRGIDLDAHAVRGRDGITGARRSGDIGFASLRGGSVAGDHMVIFASEHERIELGHRAENRALFAHGAVQAALWLAAQKAGRYEMAQALGLN